MTIGTKVKLKNPNSEADWLVGDVGVVSGQDANGISVEMEDDGRIVIVGDHQIEVIEAAPEMTDAERQLASAMQGFGDIPGDAPETSLVERLREAMLQYATTDLSRRELNELMERDKQSASLVGGLLMSLAKAAMDLKEERAINTVVLEAFSAGRAVERVMGKERAA